MRHETIKTSITSALVIAGICALSIILFFFVTIMIEKLSNQEGIDVDGTSSVTYRYSNEGATTTGSGFKAMKKIIIAAGDIPIQLLGGYRGLWILFIVPMFWASLVFLFVFLIMLPLKLVARSVSQNVVDRRPGDSALTFMTSAASSALKKIISDRRLGYSTLVFMLSIVMLLFFIYSGPSSEQIATASKSCEEFVKEKFEKDTHIFDTWSKKGKIVVEVGYRNPYSSESSYSVRLCVVDDEKGTIQIPGLLNDNEWNK